MYLFYQLPEVVAGGIYDVIVLINTDINTDSNKAQGNPINILTCLSTSHYNVNGILSLF